MKPSRKNFDKSIQFLPLKKGKKFEAFPLLVFYRSSLISDICLFLKIGGIGEYLKEGFYQIQGMPVMASRAVSDHFPTFCLYKRVL